MHTLFMLLTPVGILVIFMSFMYSTLKNNQHKILCTDFCKEYGYYPDDISAYERGGLLLTFQKDIHFLLALLFKENSFFVRNINKDLYKFIREQPKQKTSWIKIKFFLLISGVLILITDYAIFSLFIKNAH
ncbi:hypothetical protein [Citrobacter koseri]|uniref:hypothetical protein n=1 Tax=Citrobacter koseri TaxID=545 RepID=UPI000664EF72|nr:hypothetical protein [Citrobacter koseri]